MIVTEIKKDLFKVDKKYALAHCISSDCALGAGIARQFNKEFGSRRFLKSQGKYSVGMCAYQHYVDRHIFHLITKEKYWQKPTYDSLAKSLEFLKNQIIELNIQYLAIPRIGCGLDKLNWECVKEIIIDTFSKINIEILVCVQ